MTDASTSLSRHRRPAPGNAGPTTQARRRVDELEQEVGELHDAIDKERSRRVYESAAATRRHAENRRALRVAQRRIDELEQRCRLAEEASVRLERANAELRVRVADAERAARARPAPRPRVRP